MYNGSHVGEKMHLNKMDGRVHGIHEMNLQNGSGKSFEENEAKERQ